MCCISFALDVYVGDMFEIVVVFDIYVSFLDFTSSVVFGCVVSVDHTVDICGGIAMIQRVLHTMLNTCRQCSCNMVALQ